VLVFIYMFLLMASAHPECMLWTLAAIFVLYVIADIFMIREHFVRYDQAATDAARASARQIWNVYAGGFTGEAQIPRGPAITLAWTAYFVLLAIAGSGRAYAHVRTTVAFAVIGLVGYWVDAASPPTSAGRHAMRWRATVIVVALATAAVYFRLISDA
jgi:hypothetical protein